MSEQTTTRSERKATPRASAGTNLRGLLPYLARYKGAIAMGLLTLVVMGVIGSIVPLTTGVITDTLAGSARPFETSVKGLREIPALQRLSELMPYYQPRSRQTMAIYCLLLIGFIAIKGVTSFATRM